jgi:hypothetical protein
MDANSEKKAIRKQNGKWIDRETSKKPRAYKDKHPWYYTCHLVKSRIDKLANFDINNNDIKRD